MATMLLISSEQAFCFKPCSVARAFAKAPFVIAFAPVFMGGNIAVDKRERTKQGIAALLHPM